MVLVDELDGVGGRGGAVEHELRLLHDLPNPHRPVATAARDAALSHAGIDARDFVLVTKPAKDDIL